MAVARASRRRLRRRVRSSSRRRRGRAAAARLTVLTGRPGITGPSPRPGTGPVPGPYRTGAGPAQPRRCSIVVVRTTTMLHCRGSAGLPAGAGTRSGASRAPPAPRLGRSTLNQPERGAEELRPRPVPVRGFHGSRRQRPAVRHHGQEPHRWPVGRRRQGAWLNLMAATRPCRRSAGAAGHHQWRTCWGSRWRDRGQLGGIHFEPFPFG